jgi:long-chain-fatty-acid--CoA ligase ACSBG
MKGQNPGLKYKLFNKLVYSSVKKKLGLDQAEYLLFGAAPMPSKTRNFFFHLGMFVNNIFGMSETSGPMTGIFKEEYADYNLKSAGKAIEGTEIHILSDSGEICFRGRNIFMGYLKNEEATRKTIDRQRRLHSGDVGKLDEKGNLMITGRIKELLVTAGGENVAPVIIENIAKEYMPYISNIMLIGDQRKFISCLISLRTISTPSEDPVRELDPEIISYFQKQGIPGLKTVDDAVDNQKVIDLVNQGKPIYP